MDSKPIVVYDANVLYPPSIRDLFVRLAVARLVQARWTDRILDELVRSVSRARPEHEEGVNRSRQSMEKTLPSAKVTGLQYLIPSLQLPDPDDRHVLAAAIHSGAKAIVTYNLKDFPKEILSPYDIEAWSPDIFVSSLLKYNTRSIINILKEQSKNLKNPPITFDSLLDRLNKNGLEKSIGIIRKFLT